MHIVASTLADEKEILTKILNKAQSNIEPVDNQVLRELDMKIGQEIQEPVQVKSFNGDQIDKNHFVNSVGSLLKTHEQTLEHFA